MRAMSWQSKLRKSASARVGARFFFSSRRRHTRWTGDWSSDVCSSDLPGAVAAGQRPLEERGSEGAHLLINFTPDGEPRKVASLPSPRFARCVNRLTGVRGGRKLQTPARGATERSGAMNEVKMEIRSEAIARVSRKPDLARTGAGFPVCRFAVATAEGPGRSPVVMPVYVFGGPEESRRKLALWC